MDQTGPTAAAAAATTGEAQTGGDTSVARAPQVDGASPTGSAPPPPAQGTTPAPALRKPKLWLLLGLALVVIPPFVYGLQVATGILWYPWYVALFATLGAVLLLAAWAQHKSVLRGALVVLAVALAGFEWYAITKGSALPPYNGPLQVGQPFPEFFAMRPDGTRFTQAGLVGDLHTLIVVYKGNWCPYCMAELAALDKHFGDFRRRKFQIVAVSNEDVADAQATQQNFPNLVVLSDQAQKLIDAAGIPRDEQAGAPLPTLIVVDKDGRVLWINRPRSMLGRPSPDNVLSAIDEVLPEVF